MQKFWTWNAKNKTALPKLKYWCCGSLFIQMEKSCSTDSLVDTRRESKLKITIGPIGFWRRKIVHSSIFCRTHRMIWDRGAHKACRVIEMNGRGRRWNYRFRPAAVGKNSELQREVCTRHNAPCSTLFLVPRGNNVLQYYCCVSISARAAVCKMPESRRWDNMLQIHDYQVVFTCRAPSSQQVHPLRPSFL